jgi:hypothetical protein
LVEYTTNFIEMKETDHSKQIDAFDDEQQQE